MKTAEEMKRVVGECAAATASQKVRVEQLRTKEMECEVLRLNLVKEKERRREEELRAKDLRREIASAKIERMDLWERIVA